MKPTPKQTPFLKAKLALATASLIIGVPALAFALFGWTQSVTVSFGDALRYVAVLGSLGAMVCGGMMLAENWGGKKPVEVSRRVKAEPLEFLVMVEYEDRQEA